MDFGMTGCFKTILEKYADPLVKRIAKMSVSEWEKFKVDFDIAFSKYIQNSYDKYSKIKTILYRTEPKYIYDFFEIPNLEKGHGQYIKADDVSNILDISNFIIIQGTGGIGKSTLLKHLFINELKKKDLIPIFLELKDINDINGDYEIADVIFEKLNNLGSSLKKEFLEYALESGCFLFLLDGYDEILTDKKDFFFKRLDSFCDKYASNYYIISSRPYSEFIEFQRFTVLSTCFFDKEQAKSLVNKIEFDLEIKLRFIKTLDENLFDKHQSFASNPLLLNIMLLTFDNYAEIPEKLHLFYANAFETLYSKHDATKAGYKRELRSKLSYDSFKKVFSYFCFISYSQGKIEFSYEDLESILKKSLVCKVNFEIAEYIYDLINSLCVLYRDGLNYKFAHRSFQEYFSAVFLKELSDESMKRMGIQMLNKDVYRAATDGVFDMLYDMAEDRFEQNILLPVLEEFEKECSDESKYNFYFTKIVHKIRFSMDSSKERPVLWLSREMREDVSEFIFKSSYYYVDRSEVRNEKVKKTDSELLSFLVEKKGYELNTYFTNEQIKSDSSIYNLLKRTWIGERVEIISKLSKKLNEKQKETEIDLSNLI